MSAPIDVLAVMDAELARAEASAVSTASAAAHSLRDAAGKAKQQQTADAARARADAIRAARAAVAELVEAATRANGEHSAPHDCYATGPLTGNAYRDLVECPGCRLAAALARVQGGAA